MAAFTGAYDRNHVALLVSHLRAGSVALDIGASLGLYTVQLADKARDVGASVIAVEPIPSNVAIIRANIARNDLEAYASVVQVALGAEEGLATMLIEDGGAGNATVASGVPEPELARHSSQGGLGPRLTIPIHCLDTMSFDQPVSVVKIDAEGFEMDVLAGAERFIATHRPVILAEFSEPWMQSRGRRLDEPFEWARDHAYSVHRVTITRSGKILKRTRLQVTAVDTPAARGESELLMVPR
jgi:FkbM family methyltransferase